MNASEIRATANDRIATCSRTPEIASVAHANRILERAGYPGLEVSKAEGIYYLIGDEGVVNHAFERCLHVVRIKDLDQHWLLTKAASLTTEGASE